MSVETNEVADRLHSAAIHLLRRAREHDQESGLSPARLSALSVVVFRGPLTLGELAAAEDVRSATMTGIVNGLENEAKSDHKQPKGGPPRTKPGTGGWVPLPANLGDPEKSGVACEVSSSRVTYDIELK